MPAYSKTMPEEMVAMVEIIMCSKNGCDKAIMRSENGGDTVTVQLLILRSITLSGEKIRNSPIFSPRNDLKTSLLLAGKRISKIGEFI